MDEVISCMFCMVSLIPAVCGMMSHRCHMAVWNDVTPQERGNTSRDNVDQMRIQICRLVQVIILGKKIFVIVAMFSLLLHQYYIQ